MTWQTFAESRANIAWATLDPRGVPACCIGFGPAVCHYGRVVLRLARESMPGLDQRAQFCYIAERADTAIAARAPMPGCTYRAR